jgi:hypothetical protein
MLHDPRWLWHAAAELNAKVDGPAQYGRAPPNRYKDIFNHITFGAPVFRVDLSRPKKESQ